MILAPSENFVILTELVKDYFTRLYDDLDRIKIKVAYKEEKLGNNTKMSVEVRFQNSKDYYSNLGNNAEHCAEGLIRFFKDSIDDFDRSRK